MTDPTAAVEVWARMLCAADVHVNDGDHIAWQQLPRLMQNDYRKAARWLLPRLTVAQPAAVPSVPADADLCDRIAQALADNDGWVWAEGFDKTRSPSFQGYLRAADAVLAALPAPADRAGVLREAAVELRKQTLLHDDCVCVGELRRMADEAEYVATPCSFGACEPGGEPCTTHERLMAHGEGDHELCRPDCGVTPAALPAPADRAAGPFVPPAADGLPLAALDSATDGASALDAWARDPHGRNFVAHALVQLARDGWLRTERGEGFEPVLDRETPEPEDPAELRRKADEAQQAGAEAPLSPYMSHPACGFHWHGRDGMDVPIRDGQPVCPRCELRTVRTAVLREAAVIAAQLPTPDCAEMSSLTNAWDCGTYAVATELRRMADEAQQAGEQQ